MAKLPEGWVVADLGEFCEGIRGVTYKPDDLAQINTEKTITLLRSNNIKAGALNFKDVQHVAQKNVNQKQVAQLGDIAVCMSNGSKRLVGKSAAFKYIPEGHRYTVGSFCSIFRPLKSACPVFVEQVFCSDQFQKQVDFSLAGSAINNLKNSDLITYQFLKPPVPEQQKIATILSSVDDVIEKTRAQIDKLKDLKTGLMQELLTKGIGHTEFKDSPVGRIPVRWDVLQLGDICKVQGGYAFKSADAVDDGCRWLKIANVGRGQVLWNDKSFLPNEFLLKHKDFILKNGDIVLALTRPVISGELKVARTTEGDVPSLLNQRVARVIPKTEVAFNDYLFALFSWGKLASDIEDEIFGTDPPNVSTKQIESMRYAIPPLDEQRLIADSISSVSNRIYIAFNKLEQLKQIKKALMQDLLTGKVRVNLTDKESAVV